MPHEPATQKTRLRNLPSIDSLLRTETANGLRPIVGEEHLAALARRVTDELRQEIITGHFDWDGINLSQSRLTESLLSEVEKRLAKVHRAETARGVRRVINATGVILHTNLGRAPLSKAARFAIAEEAAGYSNLEFDLDSGSRGRRGARAEDLLATLTGTEAALVVNNCAAAALLVLSVLARDGETIVSRGELVEIGGDFRVPEVMAQSGTRMVEVGTTNRTKLVDYQKAITDHTRLIMRVHTSNYRIIGFTKTPTLKELATLAHDQSLLLYEDAGSGALIDFSPLGIEGEPIIRESFAAGVDVISFSGDKLLGGPQAGLLVGRAEVIERMRKHSLYRALRADKLRIAALEATLDAYARNATTRELPTHLMMSISFDELKSRATEFIEQIQKSNLSTVRLELVEGESAIGGGAAPTARLRSPLVSITHANRSANQIEEQLRRFDPPVIARIENDRVLLDLRTVASEDEASLATAVVSLTQ